MPFAQPTIPFVPTPERFGSIVIVRNPTAAASRLDASIGAMPPLGRCATLAALGFNAGVAPARARALTVTATADSFENGHVAAFTAYAASFAGLRIFVEEFSPAGAFLRAVAGPMTVVYDGRATVFGYDVRSMERRTRTASFVLPVVAGRFYRAWIDSVQSVFVQGITGPSAAVSNFAYTLRPVFFEFG